MNGDSFARGVAGCQNVWMQKSTFLQPSNFLSGVAISGAAAILLAGTIFGSPSRAAQSASSPAQQAPASSAAQDSSAASTPTKPADKTTPDAKAPAKKPTTTKTSQANDAAKASSSGSAPAASTKQAATPAGQAGTTKTAQAGATKTGQAAATKTGKAGASRTSTAKSAAPLTLNTPKDKQSYAIGINVGKGLNQNLKQSGVDIDPAILTRAIRDVLSGGKQLMTDQEAQETLKALQAEMRTAQEEKTKQLAEANKKEGDEFLAANKAKEGVNTLPDGLQYKVLQEGTGPKPSATDADTLHYRGPLVNGTELDSSHKRAQHATCNVTGITKAWTDASDP